MPEIFDNSVKTPFFNLMVIPSESSVLKNLGFIKEKSENYSD